MGGNFRSNVVLHIIPSGYSIIVFRVFLYRTADNIVYFHRRANLGMDEIPFQKYLGIGDRPHGTALSTIINYYDPDFKCDGFKRIWFWMSYIVQLDFSGTDYIGREELLKTPWTYYV